MSVPILLKKVSLTLHQILVDRSYENAQSNLTTCENFISLTFNIHFKLNIKQLNCKKRTKPQLKLEEKHFNLLLNISSRICIHSITNKLQKKIAFIIYTTFYIFKLIRQCSRPHIICIWKSIKSFFLHIMI